MHELAISQALIDQVIPIATQHRATAIQRIVLQIGPLAGVEPALLRHAWPLAAAGTLAAAAELAIEQVAIRVYCPACNQESSASSNRLICGHCGHWQTRLLSGDELILAALEMTTPNEEESNV
jgi:hydrogenase nickel incorporation protein HypA/HybF